MNKLTKITLVLSLILLSGNGRAAQRIAIVSFELSDMSSLPNTPAELQRTASMAPLLHKALRRAGDYEIVFIDADAQKLANAGFGYLFRFHDLAAQLGQRVGADWIIVSQHSKPSFLVSYLVTHLIRVKNQTLAAHYDIELKGNHEKVTYRSINRLAEKVHESIERAGQR
ncbi:DUF2380 domain-containing protein [Methylomonas sp. LL1]|uniref:DUF2380 domain-containing protein n=1 Tax=Methylomonas sp. LL1 TaxID=2785785 RepID=UPI0018C39392|nr:DUF2380 domain-containing protein [Methylomonas sp. LL1]QPK64665.1 DUF2380 domain-containing protein [Methylomonas sp. LL1]